MLAALARSRGQSTDQGVRVLEIMKVPLNPMFQELKFKGSEYLKRRERAGSSSDFKYSDPLITALITPFVTIVCETRC